jgi:hypothetical protein
LCLRDRRLRGLAGLSAGRPAEVLRRARQRRRRPVRLSQRPGLRLARRQRRSRSAGAAGVRGRIGQRR